MNEGLKDLSGSGNLLEQKIREEGGCLRGRDFPVVSGEKGQLRAQYVSPGLVRPRVGWSSHDWTSTLFVESREPVSQNPARLDHGEPRKTGTGKTRDSREGTS